MAIPGVVAGKGPANVITLGEGWTPILPLTRYGRRIGVPGLLAKDEGMLPTGSFKARGRRSASPVHTNSGYGS